MKIYFEVNKKYIYFTSDMELTSTKVTKQTLTNAKAISEITGQTQYRVIHDAVKEKKEALKKKAKK